MKRFCGSECSIFAIWQRRRTPLSRSDFSHLRQVYEKGMGRQSSAPVRVIPKPPSE